MLSMRVYALYVCMYVWRLCTYVCCYVMNVLYVCTLGLSLFMACNVVRCVRLYGESAMYVSKYGV